MIQWVDAHRRSILFFLLVLGIAGAGAAWQLPVGLFPVIDFPRIVVTVDAGDRPVDRMVVELTRPIEQALREVPDVGDIRSTSSRGSAEFSVNFQWGDDMVAAQLQVESAVNRILTNLPQGTRFEVRRMDPTVFPVLGLSLTSDHLDAAALYDFASYQLRPLLSGVPGVAHIEVLGGKLAEVQILVDPARLDAAGLSSDDIAHALTANNVVSALGRIEDQRRLYLTLADNGLTNAEQIGHVVLKAGPGGAIELHDVAEVSEGLTPSWTRVTANGHEAVLVNLRQNRGASTLQMVRAVHALIDAHANEFPSGIHIASYYDQSELVDASIGGVRDAILVGAVLSGLVLLVFLGDWRLMLIVAAVLPLVLSITALILKVLGLSFNTMTLGGMAAAVGLVIDDSVVMIEHLARRAQATQRASVTGQSLLPAAREMLKPLLGSSLATTVIFVPLSFLSGVTGGFFRALAVTLAAALIVSFVVAILAVPILSERLIRRPAKTQTTPARSRFDRLCDRYVQLASWSLSRPPIVAGAAFILLASGSFCWSRLPSGFIPHTDEGGFNIDYYAEPGTSLTETDRLLRQVETLIQATPEIDGYSRRTGLQLGGSLTEANEGDFFIHLKPFPRRAIDDIASDLRARIESNVPGLHIETAQLMEDLIGDLTAVPQPVEVKLFGADRTALERAARSLAAELTKVPGLVEVQDGLLVAGDALEIKVDSLRAALEGLDPDSVTRQIATLTEGNVIGQLQSGDRPVNVRLWSIPKLREHAASLAAMRLLAADGHQLLLSRVASISTAAGQPQIVRENLEQMIAVTARLEGRDLGGAMSDVRRSVAGVSLPATLRVEYGGLYAQQQASFRGLSAVFGAAILLVAGLLLYLYERWTIVAAILITVLLCVTTVFIGLWLCGAELDISAMMGLTMILGIVTEIAVFYFSELDISARTDAKALIDAGRQRLRPILMTTVITIFALLPLALGLGSGASMLTPLAIAIIAGLIAALPLVLLLMPALYFHLQRLSERNDVAVNPF